MGIYDRNKGVPGTKPAFGISYTITRDLQLKFKLKKPYVREAAGTNQRAAKALLAQRNREVQAGTWQPVAAGSGHTVAAYVEWWCEKRKTDGVRSTRQESQRLRDHVVPVIGHMRMDQVRRKDVLALVQGFALKISVKTKELPSPRMVHRVYEDLRTMFAYAVEVDEIVPATPCTLKVKRGELPKKRDKDRRWRALAMFTRDEILDLIYDERIPLRRRVTYALLFLTGSRVGEIVALRWVDYDPTLKPLGRILIVEQHGGDETKTENPRAVPVHPLLAAILAAWKLEGFALFFRRKPTSSDYIVPRLRTRGGKPPTVPYQDARRVWVNLQEDLELLGHRRRRVHDMRRTLASLAMADGADKYFLQWITHGPQKDDAFDDYVTPPWATLCEQIACLKLEPRAAAPVVSLDSKRKRL